MVTESHSLAGEPQSLYAYARPEANRAHILAALYDGPIDQTGAAADYGFMPVLVEALPSPANGDAVLQTVSVAPGALVVDALDRVVALAEGVRLRHADGTVFTYTGANAGIPLGNAPSLLNRDYTITAEIVVPKGGAEGMIATLGGRFGGYGLYLLKGKPVFVYNLLNLKRYRWEGGVGAADWLGGALKPGKHTIEFDFKYDGPGPGKGGTGVFTVDGKVLATQKIPHSIPLMMTIDETFDIGSDTRSPVDDSYKLPFRFTGTIAKLTYKLGREQVTAEAKKEMTEAVARARD